MSDVNQNWWRGSDYQRNILYKNFTTYSWACEKLLLFCAMSINCHLIEACLSSLTFTPLGKLMAQIDRVNLCSFLRSTQKRRRTERPSGPSWGWVIVNKLTPSKGLHNIHPTFLTQLGCLSVSDRDLAFTESNTVSSYRVSVWNERNYYEAREASLILQKQSNYFFPFYCSALF